MQSDSHERSKIGDTCRIGSGVVVSELNRKYQISPAIFYRWKKEHAENQSENKRRIKELEAENKRLKKMYANQSISAKKLIQILEHVLEYRDKPAYIRCDNGSESIGQKLELWSDSHDIVLKHIQPGKPSQNRLVERLNKTLRVECLNLCWFTSMEELDEEIQNWS